MFIRSDLLLPLQASLFRFQTALGAPVADALKLDPNPLGPDGRLLVALDDTVNPKTGRRIFGYGFFHDHTAKRCQSRNPWSQHIVTIGLLKKVERPCSDQSPELVKLLVSKTIINLTFS